MMCALSPLTCVWLFPSIAVCRRKPFCRPHFRSLWGILILLFGCRLGEASNPGPTPDDNFVLGAFNPSGLPSKAPYIAAHLSHGDIWAVSGTHLCKKGFNEFKAGLRFADSPFKYVITGNHVPAQTSQTHHGHWKGVALLSKYPTRALPAHGPHEVYESSRALVAATLVNDIWITGGVVYGEPDGHLYPCHKQHNESLLQSVAGQVCALSAGPRFVAGDWNSSPNSLPVFDLLHDFGFRDVQEVAWERWGIRPQATCKRKTRKDFCYLSPELQALMIGCSVEHDIWPDHAVLQGVFRKLSCSIPKYIWPVPSDLVWPKEWEVDPDVWRHASGTLDERYATVWRHIEQRAVEALPFPASKHSLGRACTTTTKAVVAGKLAPVKNGRRGDFKPQFLCASFRHAQWVRQVRRLQSFVHFAQGNSECPDHPHALAVWGSIIRAKGFLPSFCQWWETCKFRVHGALSRIPMFPPDVHQAVKIFESVALAVRDFEAHLKKSSRSYAKLRRERNPNMIFQDIKTQPDRGIDLLLRPLEAVVHEVRVDDSALVLDRSFEIQPDHPVVCNGAPVAIIHAEDNCLWVEDLTQIQVGDSVTQLRRLGLETDIGQAFIDAWKEKWGRHAEVPPTRWEPILDFARAKLPKVSMTWPRLDPTSLREMIAQKKTATSHGLDGVTLRDLKALPLNALQNFCDMFIWAEVTGEWPSQVTAGRVTSLAKTEQPQTPMDFRPITVFSLLYRCWGSFHSKHMLHALDPHLPVGLFGSRPQCFAGQVWSQVLWSIENAQINSIGLCGMLADLQKAFNMLPRVVAIEACAILGAPLPVLVGWAGALSQMQRRFQIRDSLSEAVWSNCGFPEGDALSCVAMMVVDFIFHEWFRHYMPLAQPISYVDDWQLLVCDPNHMQAAAKVLDDLVAELDLVLDKRKTHVWAIQPEDRALLRQQGFCISMSCKSLGAHMQLSKKHTNCTQMDRIQSLQPLWPRLRLSACGYSFKVRALKSAAWPRGLHAIPATTLSLSTFKQLRAGAMKGIGEDHAGSNSALHLGLVERPAADPHYWSILQTFRFVKDCGRCDVVQDVLALLAHGDMHVHNSITSTLLTRIQFMGWHVNAVGQVVDMFGAFSIFDVSCTELEMRMEWQWLQIVVGSTAHRVGIGGLARVWPQSTRLWLLAQNPSDQALYRKLLNGTHVTQDGKKYSQESSEDTCPYCQCSDSRFHRFWQCEHFAWARTEVPDSLLNEVCNLPEAVTCFGWDLSPSTMFDWWHYFVSLPPQPALREAPRELPLHLFTDGSCFYQSLPHLRFAAWAVVLASPDLTSMQNTHIVESGVLPGLLQSAVRAELYAILRALEFARAGSFHITLWSDCHSVVCRLRRLLHGSQIKSSSAHADLWNCILHLVQGRSTNIQVRKVVAHQDISKVTCPEARWIVRHNRVADREAVAANFRRPQEFWDLFSRHFAAVEYVNLVNFYNRQVPLSISQAVVRDQNLDDGTGEATPLCSEMAPLPLWKGLGTLSIPSRAVKWYGKDIVCLTLSWFWDVLYTSTEPIKWVSHLQLYADYMAATGNPGPVKVNGWKNGADVPLLALKGFSYKLRVKWFIKILKECLRHLGQAISFQVGLPYSNMVKMHTGVFAVPWPAARLDAIDRWFYSCCPFAFRRQSKAVDSLPYVYDIDGVEKVVLTSLD